MWMVLSSPFWSLMCSNTRPALQRESKRPSFASNTWLLSCFGLKQARCHLARRGGVNLPFWDLTKGQKGFEIKGWGGGGGGGWGGGVCLCIPNERWYLFLLTCCDGSFRDSVRLWWGGDASGCVLHAPRTATLDGLFDLLAEGCAIAALESVFPALHPLTGAAGAGVAGAACTPPTTPCVCVWQMV